MKTPTRSFLLILLLLPPAAIAQVTPGTPTFQTTASANTPGCMNSGGGPFMSPASATCVDGQGYTAAGSSAADLTQDSESGTLSVSADAAATTIGSLGSQQSTGTASGNVGMSWSADVDVHYSLSTAISGDAFARLSDSSGVLPPSGIITSGTDFGFNGDASAFANAQEPLGMPQSVMAIPARATAEVTFVPVGSPMLIMGTVTAGGVAKAGLLVEALDAGLVVVSSTFTGDDGTYLLPGIAVTVTLRISDPEGRFATEVSPPLVAPATFDTDLMLITIVPLLTLPWGLVLFAALAGAGRWGSSGRDSPPGSL